MQRFNRFPFGVLFAALFFSTSCTTETEPAAASCPAGMVEARLIEGDEILLEGAQAVGGGGDYLLRSDKAAFVITGVDRGDVTYYHYGGILADAAPLQECNQVADDQLEELGLLFGTLNLGSFHDSTMRAFRAEKAEIVNDGSDGKAAHLRMTGVDDYYWLVEYTLIGEAYKAGDPKPLSEPYGVKVFVDYILQPGGDVLEIVFSVENIGEKTRRLLAGPELIFGDLLDVVAYGETSLEVGGFGLRGDIPFLTGGSPHGSYAFAMENARLSMTEISGVNANVDLRQALDKPLDVAPGETATFRMFFAAGPTDDHSAARALQPYLPEPLREWPYTLKTFSGTTVDAAGSPVSGATIEVQLKDSDGLWLTLERFYSDAQGRFGPDLAFFDQGHTYRMIVSAEGRNPTEPVEFKEIPAEPQTVTLPAKGEVKLHVEDGTGRVMPAKLSLYRNGERHSFYYSRGDEVLAVPPGVYEIAVTRGWEHETHEGSLTVPDDGQVELSVELPRIIDTSGYLLSDTHVHQAPSPDSDVLIPDRLLSAAAEGLEIPVATDHEIIVGMEEELAASGLTEWVNTVIGQEFTASIPEHMTIFPLEPDGTLRGGPLPWYQKGLETLFKDAYGRGAKVGAINHPGYLNLIGYDYVTGEAELTDPTLIGLPAGEELVPTNFHAIEYMNGTGSPFAESKRRFINWMGYLNHGIRITALGSSDVHSLEGIGESSNYFGVIEDQPALFHPDNLVDAVHRGDNLVSTGAFARASINGEGMGSLASTTGSSVTLKLQIEALPQIDVTHFRVYVNCDEQVKQNTTNPDGIVKFDGDVILNIPEDAHVVVAGFGTKNLPRGLRQFDPTNVPRFTTNPIYVDASGNGGFEAPGSKTCTYTTD